jgi:predicted nucleic acid-binding protein
MIILDTNIVAALMGNGADIDPWLATVPRHELYTTVMTRAETSHGLSRLPAGRQRSRLADKADALFHETQDRLLPFDAKAADRYGELVAACELAGRLIAVSNAIIASIAWVHRAALATRNGRDFEDCGLQVLNPYDF